MENRRIFIIGGLVLLGLFTLIACLALTGAGAYWLAREISQSGVGTDFTPGAPSTQSGGPTPEVVRPAEPPSDETLNELIDTVVPENNPVELAERLLGISDIPETFIHPGSPFEVGDRRSFWVTNTNTDQTSETEAVLRYVSEHLYFWVEDGVQYDDADMRSLVSAFENEMLPLEREFFGTEWTPGIDNDPHIYILYATNVGFTTAGYFSSRDSVHPLAQDYSNAAEMFVINADNSPLGSPDTYGVLAHEFQHMIHWYRDRNETSWINEGLSELATLLTGYSHTGFANLYTSSPDLQLNDWPEDDNATPPHYGAAFMFVTYFLDRLGQEATQTLVADPDNGLDSVDGVLEEIGYLDPLRGDSSITADEFVLDWIIANYLKDEGLADGRFGYGEYSGIFTAARATETINECAPGVRTRDVRQYGVDYIRIACPGQHTLYFEGSTQVQLLPESPYSGDYAYWSNKGDESDMTLTHIFDFTDVEGSLTFNYWTWYNIENDWDYVYLLASANGGENWSFLDVPSGTSTDPNGNNYGFGWTGYSGGSAPGEWIEESVDLSEYAGQEVMLRFEYVTDAALNGEGLLVDDISIPEIGYFTDFEADHGGWEAAGFARVQNVLPQHFQLALIYHGDQTTVEYLDLPEDIRLEIQFEIGDDVDAVTLVVLGTTRFTRQPASYRFDFLP